MSKQEKPDVDRLAREIRLRRDRVSEALRAELGDVGSEEPVPGRLSQIFATFREHEVAA